MFEDIVKSIKAALYERTSSPLLGAFSISWILWNFRFFLILFAAIPLDDKLSRISGYLSTESPPNWLLLFVGPLATALAFLLLYPIPARWIFKYTRWQQKKLRDVRQAIEDEEVLSAEESRRIRKRNVELELENERDVKRLEEDKEHLQSMLAEAQSVASEASERQTNAENRLEEREAELNRVNRELDKSRHALERELLGGESASRLDDSQLRDILTTGEFALVHNVENGRVKKITFLPDGLIGDGKNKFENSWRVTDGTLELIQEDSQLHSRFVYRPESRIFVHTGSPDTRSARGQYILPLKIIGAKL